MTDDKTASFTSPGVSLSIVFDLPFPWPPPADLTAMQDGGSGLTLVFTYTGRIKVEARDRSGKIVAEGESGRIRPRGVGQVPIVLIANKRNDENVIELRINGALSNARTGPVRLDNYTDPSTGLQPSGEVDRESEDMRKRRRNRAADYRSKGIDEKRQAGDLRREVRLLTASLKRLQEGDADEIVTVSGHLRKIIGRGKGNHALQDYAALNDLHLDVWTVPPEPLGSWTPKDLEPRPDLWLQGTFSTKPSKSFAQRTDLDVWLDQIDGAIAGKLMSNGDFLHAIADKIGAHLDVGERLTLDRLALAKASDIDFTTNYLIGIGGAVLALCLATLAVD